MYIYLLIYNMERVCAVSILFWLNFFVCKLLLLFLFLFLLHLLPPLLSLLHGSLPACPSVRRPLACLFACLFACFPDLLEKKATVLHDENGEYVIYIQRFRFGGGLGVPLLTFTVRST